MFPKPLAFVAATAAFSTVSAHIGAYHSAMFCLNGYSNTDQPNNDEVSNPLYQKSFDDFWFHGQCKDYPPADGEYLEIPVGGKATVEHAGNRGQTTLSFNGTYAGLWPDGQNHDDYDDGTWNNTCITSPNLHAENSTRAAGTVLAIAYKSDINEVQYEDLVVISVLPSTPWHRVAQYDIPADLPPCDDCICAYSWIPNHCGIPNMYMNGIRCKVTGARSDAPQLAKAQPAKWCEDNADNCVKGAKGITIYNQAADANTIDLSGIYQKDGQEASPGYNDKMGFSIGAQNDIYETSGSSSTTTDSNSSPTTTPSSSSSTTTDSDSSTTPESSTTATWTSAESTPTGGDSTCTDSSIGTRDTRGHRKHQRRIVDFMGFHLSVDAE